MATKATLTMMDDTGAEILAMELPERHAASIMGNICYDAEVATKVNNVLREHLCIPEHYMIGWRFGAGFHDTETRQTGPEEFTVTDNATLALFSYSDNGPTYSTEDESRRTRVKFVRVCRY